MMRCPYCKAETPPNAAACAKCGKAMPVSEATFVGNDEHSNPSPTPDKTPGTPGTPGGWSIGGTREPAPELPPGEIAAGTVLGERYHIIALVGQSGIGAGFIASDYQPERPVAAKLHR